MHSMPVTRSSSCHGGLAATLLLLSALVVCVNIQQGNTIVNNSRLTSCNSLPLQTLSPPLRYDSSDATVMAYATGYDLDVYQRYVGSLRNSGFKGKIILAVSNEMKDGVEEYLSSQNVTFHHSLIVNCTYALGKIAEGEGQHQQEAKTCVHPYPDLKARWSRFPLLRDYLVACSECTGPVLISDFRDVFFQRDPFGDGTLHVTGLEVFEEDKQQMTDHWIVNFPVANCKNTSFVEPMLCSGTTIGTRVAMIQYLTIMEQEMHEWMKDPNCCCNLLNGDDQSIHNYLFYAGKLPFAKAIPNRIGTINTVGVQASKILHAHKSNRVEFLKVDQYKAAAMPFDGSDGNYNWIGDHFGMTDKEVSNACSTSTNVNFEKSVLISLLYFCFD